MLYQSTLLAIDNTGFVQRISSEKIGTLKNVLDISRVIAQSFAFTRFRTLLIVFILKCIFFK